MIGIRLCTPADASPVAALLGELGYEVSAEAAVERLEQLSATGANPTFLACENDQSLGLIGLHCCRCSSTRSLLCGSQPSLSIVGQGGVGSVGYWSRTR